MTSKNGQALALALAAILLVVGVVCYAAFPAKTPEEPVRLMLKTTAGSILRVMIAITKNRMIPNRAAVRIATARTATPRGATPCTRTAKGVTRTARRGRLSVPRATS